MDSLKTLYDAVRAAEEKVAKILEEMKTAFDEGTEEGVRRAMELRPALDEAKAEADEANRLYCSVRDAEVDGDSPARKFVPVEGAVDGKGERKILLRRDFEQLSASERMEFVLNGGLIEERE